jgi:hypothetical protein
VGHLQDKPTCRKPKTNSVSGSHFSAWAWIAATSGSSSDSAWMSYSTPRIARSFQIANMLVDSVDASAAAGFTSLPSAGSVFVAPNADPTNWTCWGT